MNMDHIFIDITVTVWPFYVVTANNVLIKH